MGVEPAGHPDLSIISVSAKSKRNGTRQLLKGSHRQHSALSSFLPQAWLSVQAVNQESLPPQRDSEHFLSPRGRLGLSVFQGRRDPHIIKTQSGTFSKGETKYNQHDVPEDREHSERKSIASMSAERKGDKKARGCSISFLGEDMEGGNWN